MRKGWNHYEIFNNIPHFIKNCIHFGCLQYGFFVYNNKVILCKREVIIPIPDSMIPVYFCQNNYRTLFYKWCHDIQVWTVFKDQNESSISKWKCANILATDVRLLLGWNRYTLLRLLLFLAWLVVSIFQCTAVRRSHWNFLSDVIVRTTHTDNQVWNSTFISAPCKTLCCEYGAEW